MEFYSLTIGELIVRPGNTFFLLLVVFWINCERENGSP